MDSISAETKATLLSWRNYARFSKHFAIRPHIRYALASACAALIQTVAVAHILYGPALTYVSASPSRCASSDHRLRFFAARDDLSLHVVASFLGAIIHALLWTSCGAYINTSYPFHASAGKRLLMQCPRIVLLAGLSAALAAIAVTPSYPVWIEEGSMNVSLWRVILEKLSCFGAVFACTFVVLFSWNFFGAVREQLRESARGAWWGLRDRNMSDVVMERERFAVLARQAILGRGEEEREQLVRQIVDTLQKITRKEKDLVQFPGFSDASGEVWEVALEHCLAPLEFLQEIVKDCNMRLYQANEVGGGWSMGPIKLGWLRNLRGRNEKFVCGVADVCIAACEVMASVYAGSYRLDTYGVVHRTLVQAVRTLLICKEQTESYLMLRKSKEVKTGKLRGKLKEWWVVQSEYDSVCAVDDALTLTMYRIVGSFHGHFIDFVEGVEATWDRTLDRQLRMFLEYQVS